MAPLSASRCFRPRLCPVSCTASPRRQSTLKPFVSEVSSLVSCFSHCLSPNHETLPPSGSRGRPLGRTMASTGSNTLRLCSGAISDESPRTALAECVEPACPVGTGSESSEHIRPRASLSERARPGDLPAGRAGRALGGAGRRRVRRRVGHRDGRRCASTARRWWRTRPGLRG